MSNKPVPYLCGGVLFLLLNHVKQPGVSGRDRIGGKSSSHSNSEVMKDLIIALRLGDIDKEQPLYLTGSFGKDVSNYINCKVNDSSNLSFTDEIFVSNYGKLVETQHAKAMEKMQVFIRTHLKAGLDECIWLVKAILDIIDTDLNIDDSDQFFIASDGTPKTKAEIRSMNDFCLSAVLVGVMHYILLHRGDNEFGEETLNQWSKKRPGRERKYVGDAGKRIEREITVTLDCPPVPDIGVQMTATTEESKEKETAPQLAMDISTQTTEGSEESPKDETSPQPTLDTYVQKSERTDGGPERKVSSQLPPVHEKIKESTKINDCSPELDTQLYEYFKTNSNDILTYIINHDPASGPTERLLPYNIDQLTKYWMRIAPKIEDREMQETLLQILDLLSQYSSYLSDEFLRVSENQNFLIFRNQSWEEGCKLDSILRQKTTELRHALRQQYRRLHNMPEIDQAFFDVIYSEEEVELPKSAFHDPPL